MDPQMNATQYTLKSEQVDEIVKDQKRSVFGFLNNEYKTSSTVKEYAEPEKLECIFNIDKNFDIIPSSLEIMRLNLADSPFKLRQYINKNLKSLYDIIIIDCPPTISSYTKISLLASDMYVVPMKTDPLSIFGLPMLQNYISETIEGEFSHNIEFLGIILNMVRVDRVLYKELKPKIKEKWKTKLFNNELLLREEITKGLNPNSESNGYKYIINMTEGRIVNQMINITKEIMQKGRI
jgi:chromosome partitioning protein